MNRIKLMRHKGLEGAVAVTGLLAAMALSGCVVAGYSSGGGWFVWPGSFGLLFLLLILYLVLRRR